MWINSQLGALDDRQLQSAANSLENSLSRSIGSVPDLVAVRSNAKLDYIVGYEAARRIGVPFCPLPIHRPLSQSLSCIRGAGISTSIFDGKGWAYYPTEAAPVLSLGSISLCFLTSGSTGASKLIALSDGNVRVALESIQNRLEYRRDDSILSYLPMSFDYGFYQYLLSKIAGSSLYIVDSGFTMLTSRLIDDVKATVLPVVPSLLAGIFPLLEQQRVVGRSLTKVTSTGEVLSDGAEARLNEYLPNAGIFAMYGLTECKRVSIRTPNCTPEFRGSVGRPLDCCSVTLRNPDRDGIGEIVVTGDNVAVASVSVANGAAQLTNYNGRLETGDFGRVDRFGYLYVTGRRDDQIKILGHRLSIREVENAIYSIKGVMAARVAMSSNVCTAQVKASGITSSFIGHFLSDHFGSISSAIRVILVDEISVTENYKVAND